MSTVAEHHQHISTHALKQEPSSNVNLCSRSLHICCRRLSVVCRLSPTFVHPTQPVEIFGNISKPFGILGHPSISKENFTEIVPGEPLRRES